MSAHGIEAEVRALLAAEDGAGGEDQLDLAFADMPSPVAIEAEARGVAIRGPGRPPGARSRAKADIVAFIKATKRPTLLALKELVDLPLSDFRKVTGIQDPAKAFSEWRQLAELCAAYEIGRPTQRIEVPPGAVLPVVMMREMAVDPRLAHGNPPDAQDAEFEEIQGPSSAADREVARSKSHEDAEVVDFPEETDA